MSTALAGLLIAAVPALASARIAYFTGSAGQQTGGAYAAPVELATQITGAQVPIPIPEGSPADVAISPNGATAYVTDGFGSVIPISVATNTAAAPISVPGSPWAIAITPDGKSAYVTNLFDEYVSRIDLATGTVAAATIPVGSFPRAIAITPNGSRAYVVNALGGTVSVIDLASATVIDTIVVGSGPNSIAITPDGTSAYVVNRNDETVSKIDVATGKVVATINGVPADTIAIDPSGGHAYALDSLGSLRPIALASNTVAPPIPIADTPIEMAILPDGSFGFATATESGSLAPVNLASSTVGAPFAVGSNPAEIAIVPNQPPHASFTSTSPASKPGASIAFDAGGSSDSDGTVARYDWDFGDGAVAQNAGAKPSHSYAKAGTYQVTLTTTDNEGCSTAFVFTGQTAYCNGSGVARVTHPVTVPGNCPRVEGTATSFVPKLVSHHVVPGVRVRLSVNAPAHLDVKATLLWSVEGESGRANLGQIGVDVNRWRRLRLAIPGALREKLPLGTPVRVSLHIHATPRGGDACGGNNTHPTLRVHVVKVIPNAVQSLRLR